MHAHMCEEGRYEKNILLVMVVVFAILLCFGMVGCSLFADVFSGDDGKDDQNTMIVNAIEIGTIEELTRLTNESGHFKLVNDIDISNIEWEPIEGFTGVLEGNNKTISGLTINNNDENLGLFATLKGPIQNLNNGSILGANKGDKYGCIE